MGLLGSALDYDYPTTVQPRGNSHIRHSRARVLGGCSSHNTLIAFKPLPSDWDEWEAAGAKGWGAVPMEAYCAASTTSSRSTRRTVTPSPATTSTPPGARWACPRVEGFSRKPFTEGAGFFDLA